MTGLTVVIPTYLRGEVLLDTIRYLLELPERPQEILIADQTKEHPPEVLDVFQWLDLRYSESAFGISKRSDAAKMGMQVSLLQNPSGFRGNC